MCSLWLRDELFLLGTGQVAALEMKLALSVNEADLRNLRMLRDRLGAKFVAGVLLYSGTQVLSFGNRLIALPAATLWAAKSAGRSRRGGGDTLSA